MSRRGGRLLGLVDFSSSSPSSFAAAQASALGHPAARVCLGLGKRVVLHGLGAGDACDYLEEDLHLLASSSEENHHTLVAGAAVSPHGYQRTGAPGASGGTGGGSGGGTGGGGGGGSDKKGSCRGRAPAAAVAQGLRTAGPGGGMLVPPFPRRRGSIGRSGDELNGQVRPLYCN